MIKSKISIERQINERQYQFVVPHEAPLSEVLAVIDDIRLYVMGRIDEAEKEYAKQQEQVKSKE